jgi:hypothetical protein
MDTSYYKELSKSKKMLQGGRKLGRILRQEAGSGDSNTDSLRR